MSLFFSFPHFSFFFKKLKSHSSFCKTCLWSVAGLVVLVSSRSIKKHIKKIFLLVLREIYCQTGGDVVIFRINTVCTYVSARITGVNICVMLHESGHLLLSQWQFSKGIAQFMAMLSWKVSTKPEGLSEKESLEFERLQKNAKTIPDRTPMLPPASPRRSSSVHRFMLPRRLPSYDQLPLFPKTNNVDGASAIVQALGPISEPSSPAPLPLPRIQVRGGYLKCIRYIILDSIHRQWSSTAISFFFFFFFFFFLIECLRGRKSKSMDFLF